MTGAVKFDQTDLSVLTYSLCVHSDLDLEVPGSNPDIYNGRARSCVRAYVCVTKCSMFLNQ